MSEKQLIPLLDHALEDKKKPRVLATVLYEFLGLNIAAYARWAKKNITNNPYAIECTDWEGFQPDVENPILRGVGGRPTHDYALSIDFAKRLAMMARSVKGEEARQYFLDCEKAAQAIHDRVGNISFTYLRDHRSFLEDLGLFEDRDRLLLADIARTQLQRTAGLLPSGATAIATPQGFDIEEALRTVAPSLVASQLRKLTSEAGKRVAKEYRLRFAGEEPATTSRFVDGKIRPVKWYAADASEWIYPILQSYLASLGLLPTT